MVCLREKYFYATATSVAMAPPNTTTATGSRFWRRRPSWCWCRDCTITTAITTIVVSSIHRQAVEKITVAAVAAGSLTQEPIGRFFAQRTTVGTNVDDLPDAWATGNNGQQQQ